MRRFLLILIALPTLLSAQSIREVQYRHTDEIFPNPERGFFRQFSHAPGQAALTPEDVRQARADGFTLIKRNYTFSDFRDRDLDAERLALIRSDFETLRQGGVKVVLRFRYSQRIGDPDAPLPVMRRHLAQLKPLMRDYEDVIAVVSAGMIGAWGEWHASTNDLETDENMRAVLSALLEAVPESRQVQLRTARYKMRIFGTEEPLGRGEAHTGTANSRTAHHNDGFLGSANDIGTYYDLQKEKSYQESESRWLAVGGETGGQRPGSDFHHCETAVPEMERMRWSFLNIGWYGPTVQGWKEEGCFEQIDRQLGYRFALLEGQYPETVEAGGPMSVSITLRNRGWAAPYNRRDVVLVLIHTASGARHEIPLAADPRFWLPGETHLLRGSVRLPEGVRPGTYELHLWLPDPSPTIRNRPEYAIRLANRGLWQAESGLNALGHTVIVR